MGYQIHAPIIINNTRDCIVIDGKTYCREYDWTGRQIGIMMLLVSVVLIYAWYALDRIIEGIHPVRLALIYFGLPVLLVSFLLIAYSGP